MSRPTEANLDCAFVKNTLVFVVLKNKGSPGPHWPPFTTPPAMLIKVCLYFALFIVRSVCLLSLNVNIIWNTCSSLKVQCPLYIATWDIAAALPIATSTPVTNLRQYINSDLGYTNLKFQGFFY